MYHALVGGKDVTRFPDRRYRQLYFNYLLPYQYWFYHNKISLVQCSIVCNDTVTGKQRKTDQSHCILINFSEYIP